MRPLRLRRHARMLVLLLGLATAAAVATGLGSCSLFKAHLEADLLALGKNETLAARGLQRTTLWLPAAGGGEELELVYARVPAAAPAAGRRPVLLVHGTPSTLFTWAELACGGPGFDGLAAERDVTMIEVVGHGIAPAGPDPTTFQLCADYVVAAVAALGLDRPFVVGNSYGGEFAWRAARDRPDLFSGLVLMSSSGYERRPEDWLSEEIEMRENGLADLGWLLNSRERIERALAPHFHTIPPDRVEEFFLCCENEANWRSMIDLARDENGDREADIAGISVPTLLLWGADDVAYWPAVYAERFARDIPGSELQLIPGVGHYPQEERPGETAARMSAFFDRVEREGAGAAR